MKEIIAPASPSVNIDALAALNFVPATDICLTQSLYSTVHISDKDYLAIRGGEFQYDGFCTSCDKDSVFKARRVQIFSALQDSWSRPSRFTLAMHCTRGGHSVEYYFYYRGANKITKIGQFPSIEDLSGHDIKKFKPFLRDGYFQELVKANGLFSHGIGIGSFVYLRRIFEKLIRDHRNQLEEASGPVDGFDGMRMSEKIEALSKVLPSSLVKNRAIYGILSSGIHELDEEECKIYYPIVKAAIIQILEQDYEARKKRDAEDEITAELSKIQAALSRRGKADTK